MKLKKVICFFMALIFTLSCLTFAEEEYSDIIIKTEISESDYDIFTSVNVSGTAVEGLENKRITLTVERLADTPQTNKERFAVMHQGIIGADRKWQFVFNMSEYEPAGIYLLRIRAAGENNVLKKEFYLSSVLYIKEILIRIKEKNIQADELMTILYNDNGEMGIYTEIYKKIPDSSKLMIVNDLITTMQEYSVSEFKEIFNKGIIFKGISSEISGEIKSEILDYYNPEYIHIENTNYYSRYNKLSSNMKLDVLKGIKASSFDELYKNFNEQLFITESKNISNYFELAELTNIYSEYLNANTVINQINLLDDDNKSIVYKYIIENNNSWHSSSEYVTLLSYAIDHVNEIKAKNMEKIISGNSGGTSGLGSSQKISVSHSADTNVVPEVKKEIFKGFLDMNNYEWAEEAVNNLFDKGIVCGKIENYFYPQDKVTRAEFVKMLVMASGYDTDKVECKFEDVPRVYWGYKYIAAAFSNGIVNGDKKGKFNPNEKISRQDMAALIYRALVQTGKKYNVDEVKNEFTDYADIADYSKNSVLYLSAMKIISGYTDKSFRPLEYANRAEAASLIQEMMTAVEGAE